MECACLSHVCRWNVPGAVGGRHRLNAAYVRQRLRVFHHNGVRAVLADGLSKCGGRLENGHRAVPGGHTRAVHGQVMLKIRCRHSRRHDSKSQT